MPPSALQTGQYVIVTFAGLDSSGQNPAPVTISSFTIDNHAMAYANQKDPTSLYVVARGPVGAFRLNAACKSAAGNTINVVQDFSVSGGDAASVVVTVSAPSGNFIGVPGIPAGW